MLVRHLVWYDNEDDLFLSNKIYDLMDFDALADDIISAEFPDDDE